MAGCSFSCVQTRGIRRQAALFSEMSQPNGATPSLPPFFLLLGVFQRDLGVVQRDGLLWLVAAAGQRHTAQDHVGQLDDDKVEGDAFVFAGEGDGGVTGQSLRLGQMLQQLRRCRVAHPRQRDF